MPGVLEGEALDKEARDDEGFAEPDHPETGFGKEDTGVAARGVGCDYVVDVVVG